jgi:hypothetical protein
MEQEGRNMSDLIDRQALKDYVNSLSTHPLNEWDTWGVLAAIDKQPTVSPWHRVEEPPKEAGEYIVAYHPCWWNDVKTSVTEVGIDTFRGKTSWAKRKFQRVTHWMEKPEPPKEDA